MKIKYLFRTKKMPDKTGILIKINNYYDDNLIRLGYNSVAI